MKAMSHPDFHYSPWSDERRRRASIAAKKRVRLTRAIEIADGLDQRKKEARELVRILNELRVLL